MKKLFLFLLIIPNLLHAQNSNPAVVIDKNIIPKPFQKAFSKDHNNYSNIESITTIQSRNYDGFEIDTLKINYTNEVGRSLKSIYYEDNQPRSKYFTTYDEEGKNIKLEDFNFKSENFGITNTLYDSIGRVTNMMVYRVYSKKKILDTILLSKSTFKYKGVQLVERTNTGVGDLKEIFTYDDNGLLKQREGFYQPYQYFYNERGQLIQLLQYTSRIEPERLYHEYKFQYDDKDRLIIDSTFVKKSSDKKDLYVSSYEYNDLDQLIKTYDSSEGKYRETEFKYAGGKIIGYKVKTNENSGYFNFPIFVSIAEYEFPAEIIGKIEYDKFGNKIKHTRTINGKLDNIITYKIKYKD